LEKPERPIQRKGRLRCGKKKLRKAALPTGNRGPEAGSDGAPPEGFAGGGAEMPQPGVMYLFEAGEETLTVDVSGLEVKAGDILEVVFDENGKASSVSLRGDVFAPGAMAPPGGSAEKPAE
jgi:hypothetical protein